MNANYMLYSQGVIKQAPSGGLPNHKTSTTHTNEHELICCDIEQRVVNSRSHPSPLK